jgi:hypothetical protein
MTSQYGAFSLHAGLARLYARMRMNTPTHLVTQCTHAHTDQEATHYFSTARLIREGASVLHDTYFGILVNKMEEVRLSEMLVNFYRLHGVKAQMMIYFSITALTTSKVTMEKGLY